jgi:hypothetical protein
LADRVLMKIFYLLLRWLFSLAVLAFRGDQAKDAELLGHCCVVPSLNSVGA